MSGIYLNVWDEDKRSDRVLAPTPAGWPHMTMAWTGKVLTAEQLRDTGALMLKEWAGHTLTLDAAVVNTFVQAKSKRIRYDVVCHVSKEDVIAVAESRKRLLVDMYPYQCHEFVMRSPHVTLGAFWSSEEVEACFKRIVVELPITVTVTGVSLT